MREEKFSKRHGYGAQEKPIIIREAAPEGLRQFIIATVYDLDRQPSFLRNIICRELKITPDRGNWSEYPNIAGEVEDLLMACEWYQVYDIIETIASKIDSETNFPRETRFQDEVNDYFKISGIGWKLEDGKIVFRGDESFEINLKSAETVLAAAGKQTARNEIREAITDLSRKPHADITGAIQHGVACLECISREITNDKKSTLGELIKKHRSQFPSPLDTVIDKIWAYSSEQGRHLQEGREPSFDEAELLVGLSAVISTYMARKLPQSAPKQPNRPPTAFEPTDDDLPF